MTSAPRPCGTCRFRRPALNVLSVLADLDLPMVDVVPRLIDELERWHDDREREERAVVMDVAQSSKEPYWRRRPFTQEFCGAIGDRPGISNLLNPSDECDSHDAGRAPDRRCTTCRHLRRPAHHDDLLDAATSPTAGDQRFAQSAQALTEAQSRSEVLEAFRLGGVVKRPPNHLPVCDRFSDPNRSSYVVGPVANWPGACPGWQQY